MGAFLMYALLLVLAACGEAQENARLVKDVNFYFKELTQGVGPCFCEEQPAQLHGTRHEDAAKVPNQEGLPKDFTVSV